MTFANPPSKPSKFPINLDHQLKHQKKRNIHISIEHVKKTFFKVFTSFPLFCGVIYVSISLTNTHICSLTEFLKPDFTMELSNAANSILQLN